MVDIKTLRDFLFRLEDILVSRVVYTITEVRLILHDFLVSVSLLISPFSFKLCF